MYLAFLKATVKIMSIKCTSPIHGGEIFACFMLISTSSPPSND
jgi:hypothetical protein